MRSRIPRSRVTHDRWLISYADFITLLFGLFVVLFAFAKADQKKQVQVTESIDSAFRSLGLFPSAARNPSDGPISASGQVSGSGADKAVIPVNIVMGEDVMSPARVKSDLDRMGQRTLFQAKCRIRPD